MCSLLYSNHLNVSKLTQFIHRKWNTIQLPNGRLQCSCLCTDALRAVPLNSKHDPRVLHSSLSDCTKRLFCTSPALLRDYPPSSSSVHRTNADHRGSIRPGNRPDTDFIADSEEDAAEDDPSALLDDADYATLLHNAQGFGVGVMGRAGLKGGVYVVLPWMKWGPKQKTGTTSDLLLEEACALVNSLKDVVVLGKEVVKVSRESEGPVFGSGQTLNISIKIEDTAGLSAVFVSVDKMALWQIRILEKEFGVRVVDRYWVVLAIFHQHARTTEARMQVALAELPYIKSLTRHDNERAIIDRRMRRLQVELNKLRHRRDHARKKRGVTNLPSIAVVGYTNSGKTSIISALCDDPTVQGQDQLFATLDVTAHGVTFPCGLRGVLVDTVGFVQELPTPLLACFNATLQDAALADVILHVRDLSHPDRLIHHTTVVQALASINVSPTTPIITVDNKADLVDLNLAAQVQNKVLERQTVAPRTSSTASSKSCVSYLSTPRSWTPAETNFDDNFNSCEVSPYEEEQETRVNEMARHERLQHWKDIYISTPSLIVSAKTKQGLLTSMEKLEEQVLRVTERRMCRMKLPTGGEHIRILRRIVGFANETVVADCPEKTEVVCALTDKQISQFKKSCQELAAGR